MMARSPESASSDRFNILVAGISDEHTRNAAKGVLTLLDKAAREVGMSDRDFARNAKFWADGVAGGNNPNDDSTLPSAFASGAFKAAFDAVRAAHLRASSSESFPTAEDFKSALGDLLKEKVKHPSKPITQAEVDVLVMRANDLYEVFGERRGWRASRDVRKSLAALKRFGITEGDIKAIETWFEGGETKREEEYAIAALRAERKERQPASWRAWFGSKGPEGVAKKEALPDFASISAGAMKTWAQKAGIKGIRDLPDGALESLYESSHFEVVFDPTNSEMLPLFAVVTAEMEERGLFND